MATGKDQTKTVVTNLVRIVLRLLSCRLKFGRIRFRFFSEPRLPPNPIDGLVTRRGDQPGGGVPGDAFARPLLQGHREGLLQHVLREVEVPEQPDEGGERARALLAEEGGEERDRHQSRF